MLRNLLTLFLSLFIIGFNAQTIHSSMFEHNVECNHYKLGIAYCTVTSPTNHAPYTYTWSNGIVHTTNSITDSIIDLQEGIYSVIITDSQDSELGNNSVEVFINPCAMYPEAVFTPNDDGYNDFWIIGDCQYFPNAEVLIFTRLGQKVYDRKGLYEPWDGRDMFGGMLPDASYYYIIYPDMADKKATVRGCVSIVR